MKKAWNYLDDAIDAAEDASKPLVVEEFGLARDGGSYSPTARTHKRDTFYSNLCDHAEDSDGVVAGINFWAWGGEGRPRDEGGTWHVGDDWIGDPPHDVQGQSRRPQHPA